RAGVARCARRDRSGRPQVKRLRALSRNIFLGERYRRRAESEARRGEQPPCRAPAAARRPPFAQIDDLQLAERVGEVSGIVRAARRLLACVARIEKRFLSEQTL